LTTYFLTPRWDLAAALWPSLSPSSPTRFPLDHSPQSLSAPTRTEALVWTAARRNEQLIAAWPGTGRLFRRVGWALTLAWRRDRLRHRLFRFRRLRVPLGSGLFRFPPLLHPLAIPATLLPATLPPAWTLAPHLTGPPMPPTIGRVLTRRTAIPRLGILRHKERFAAFEQATSPPRPLTRALP
jgi:hypothetical protein